MVRCLNSSLRAGACVGAFALAALFGAACGGSSDSSTKSGAGATTQQSEKATPTAAPVAIITISDNKFEPAEITIKAGTTVRWQWSGNNPHSVLISGSNSGQHSSSGTFERTFSAAGASFPFQCGVHGAAMSGRITVE